MIKIVRENLYFFIPYAIFLLVGAFILNYYRGGAFEILVNQNHTVWQDTFYSYITNLGDGFFYFAFVLFLFFLNYRMSLMGIAAGILSAIITGLLKLVLFPSMPRPALFFEGKYKLVFVPNVTTIYLHSFPSGHTLTAFSIFCLLTLMCRKKFLGLLFFTLALFVGLARVYLVKHFFIDIYFGSLFGVIISTSVYYVFEKMVPLNEWMYKSWRKLFIADDASARS